MFSAYNEAFNSDKITKSDQSNYSVDIDKSENDVITSYKLTKEPDHNDEYKEHFTQHNQTFIPYCNNNLITILICLVFFCLLIIILLIFKN
jgi:hypothetical protein